MSLGGEYSPAVNAVADKLVEAGCTAVVAAGNENQDAANASPSSAELVITVGATTDTVTKKQQFLLEHYAAE